MFYLSFLYRIRKSLLYNNKIVHYKFYKWLNDGFWRQLKKPNAELMFDIRLVTYSVHFYWFDLKKFIFFLDLLILILLIQV